MNRACERPLDAEAESEMLSQVPPALRRSGIVLVLLHEPVVPAASERDCVESGEWLAVPVPLGAQGRDASFNFRFPLSETPLPHGEGCPQEA